MTRISILLKTESTIFLRESWEYDQSRLLNIHRPIVQSLARYKISLNITAPQF